MATRPCRLAASTELGRDYSPGAFRSDAVAGLVVLFITVPQVIAYAYLAGMPAETGLYTVIVALFGYALFGSSKSLAVGPTAIVAMMTLEAASEWAAPGSTSYTQTVIQLSVVTGVILILLRLVNFGSVLSFLSHAVVTGFITAAAILIMTNQIPSMLGLHSASDNSLAGVVTHLYHGLGNSNPEDDRIHRCTLDQAVNHGR